MTQDSSETPVVNDDGSTSFTITVKAVPRAVPSTDELVHRGNCGIEARAFDGCVASGELPARKLGRRVYCRRSDLLRLVDAKPAVQPVPADELGAAVAKASRRKGAR